MDMQEIWQASRHARADAIATLGELGEHFAPLINPMLMGGPAWPSRPSYQAVHLASGGTLVATSGLSDAWEDAPDGVGLGLEVYIGTTAKNLDVRSSWPLAAVAQLGNVCAGHGDVLGLLDQLGAVTVELENEGFADEVVLDNGRVCVLLGTQGPLNEVDLPNGRIRYVCATVLSPAEYTAVMSEGDAKRVALASSMDWRSD